MKKFLVVLSLVLFAATAFAADWNFYGSARVETAYQFQESDYNKSVNKLDETTTDLIFNLSSMSRVGAKVKSGNLEGRVELNSNVGVRLLYGQYDFGSFKLLIGQDWDPVNDLNFGQIYSAENGLGGQGTVFTGRHAQIKATFGDFQVAIIEPYHGGFMETNKTGATKYAGTERSMLPKLEAKFAQKIGDIDYAVMGGYQMTTIENYTTPNANGIKEIDEDDVVNAFIVGANMVYYFGDYKIMASLSYGYNQANYGATADDSGNILAQGKAYYNDGDLENQQTFMGAIGFGGKISDMMAFELGYGYRFDKLSEEPDGWDGDTGQTNTLYANMPITLAKGMFVIPEVDYINLGDRMYDGKNRGNLIYVGAKWQVNF